MSNETNRSDDRPVLSLRERKKAATRATLISTADQLFAERSFETVTLEEISNLSNVSVKTLLRYFPSKEALALARVHDAFHDFEFMLDNRSEEALACYRRHVEAIATDTLERGDLVRKFQTLISENASLEAHAMALQRRYEDTLADAISAETNDDGLTPRLLAAVAVAGNAACLRHWFVSGEPWNSDTYLAVVDFAIGLFKENFDRTSTG